MFAIFNGEEFAGFVHENVGPGYVHVDVGGIDNPIKYFWHGTRTNGKLIKVGSPEHEKVLQEQADYSQPVVVYETDLRQKTIDKIAARGFDIYEQLNILTKEIKNISDNHSDEFNLMCEVIDSIRAAYKKEKENALKNPRFSYISMDDQKAN